ncbi:MAG: type IV secretion system DNA-binding domain-containing protein [Sphingobacteriales bacterium JAD_PAG50586_3]|nr:MAG: type IV secretion system DNA-binding domain-containing protein [Sphingobacteriales bacterium JAD_PAG50586_3]
MNYMHESNDVTYFAQTNFRNQNQPFGIRQADRLMHTYIVGATGTGKTTLIKTMLMQDIEAGRGCCLLDPHADLVTDVLANIPEHRKTDVIYFNIPDATLSLRYNPLKRVSYEKRSLVASGLLEVLEKLWSTAWGVKLEHILRNCILTLLDQPQATIGNIPKLLLDAQYRRSIVTNVVSEELRNFWKKEFPHYTKYDLLPVLNKVGGLLAHPVIKRVLIENPNEISLRKAMDEGKIILVNLSKGHLGEDVSKILGAFFVSSLGMAACSRADKLEEDRRPFHIFIDEFHNFTTLSLVNMFSELRKFKVSMTVAHQYIAQLEPAIRSSVFGNAGTIISFRIGTEDAQYMAKEMHPVFEVEDFINLSNFNMYLQLMIDGKKSKGFSANLTF